MKSTKFQYFLKFYIILFSILVLASLGLSLHHLINNELDRMLSTFKSGSIFLIFLLFGLNYQKIERWLESHWKKKGT